MTGEILWAGGLGLAAFLVWGLLLAGAAAFLPRWLAWWEARTAPAGALELPEVPPAPGPSPPTAPRPFEERAPGPARREPMPPRPAPGAEEQAVAAAIALALSLYQEELIQVPAGAPAASGGGSPWALSGRWQSMQARLNLSKR